MKQIVKLAVAAAVGASAAATVAYAQMPAHPPRAVVTIYRAAPGQQEALLKWLADQDRVSAAAGIPAGQLYIHTDGDSWDYLSINPYLSDAQADAEDAAAKRMNMATGGRRAMEFRKLISSHTDTFTIGPVTAAQAAASVAQ